MRQKSRQLNGVLCPGCHKPVIKVSGGLWADSKLGVLFQVHVVAGSILFLVAAEFMATCFFEVSVRRVSDF